MVTSSPYPAAPPAGRRRRTPRGRCRSRARAATGRAAAGSARSLGGLDVGAGVVVERDREAAVAQRSAARWAASASAASRRRRARLGVLLDAGVGMRAGSTNASESSTVGSRRRARRVEDGQGAAQRVGVLLGVLGPRQAHRRNEPTSVSRCAPAARRSRRRGRSSPAGRARSRVAGLLHQPDELLARRQVVAVDGQLEHAERHGSAGDAHVTAPHHGQRGSVGWPSQAARVQASCGSSAAAIERSLPGPASTFR